METTGGTQQARIYIVYIVQQDENTNQTCPSLDKKQDDYTKAGIHNMSMTLDKRDIAQRRRLYWDRVVVTNTRQSTRQQATCPPVRVGL